MKIVRDFRVFETVYDKKRNPEMPESNRKLVNNKNHPLLTVTITRKLLKNYQFVI